MMKKQIAETFLRRAFITGTFDPFHIAHTWQLKRAHDIVPFDEAIVAVLESNHKKPNAISYLHRLNLAIITLESLTLPFTWQVISIPNNSSQGLREAKDKYLSGQPKPLRVLGSDSLIEFVDDPGLRSTLCEFKTIVTLRPETNPIDVEAATHKMQELYDPEFNPVIVPIPDHDASIPDISARNLRGDIARGTSLGGVELIVPAAKDYMQHHHLYSYGEQNT